MADIKPEALKTLRSEVHAEVLRGTKRTHSFNADFKEYDEKFVGKFTVKHPSLMDSIQIGVTKTALTGGIEITEVYAQNLVTIIATLDVVLTERPDWFNPNDPDLPYEVLEAVFLEYLDWQKSFRKPSGPSGPESSSEHTGGEVPLLANGEVGSSAD